MSLRSPTFTPPCRPAVNSRAGWTLLLLIHSLLSACAGLFDDSQGANRLANIAPSGWVAHPVNNVSVPLMVSYPATRGQPNALLVIYIEGDGHAWHRRNIISRDPTPRNPLALTLAEATPNSFDVAYVARPCQFAARNTQNCDPALWTSHRYSATNTSAISSAIDQLKSSEQQQILLVGYSGGGAVAALLAAVREDVIGLITVAANLDTSHWTSLHEVTPLSGSQNPADFSARLRQIPQVHFVGKQDKIVPASVVQSYLNAIGLDAPNHLVSMKAYDHSCCWEENWQQLFSTALTKLELSHTGQPGEADVPSEN